MKLYWRYKKGGKWTWKKATYTQFRECVDDEHPYGILTYVVEEEE